MRVLKVLAVATLAAIVYAPSLAGQTPPPGRTPVQTKVDVVLNRFQGDKKTSSLPFTLMITFNRVLGAPFPTEQGRASVRMGVDVPLGVRTATVGRTSGDTTTTRPEATPQYRNVGTSIDGYVSETAEGAYAVQVSVEDSSIYTPDAPGRGIPRIADPLAFRTFSMTNRLSMRDGQTLEFASATDKISGEVLKVNVTFTLVK